MPADRTGNYYEDVGNLRVTFVRAAYRRQEADWSGENVIRIQAYKGDPAETRKLHRGAELPVSSHMAFIELIRTLCAVYQGGTTNARRRTTRSGVAAVPRRSGRQESAGSR